MMTETSILEELRNETKYNYYDVIKNLQGITQATETSTRLANTVELFAFGNYGHYKKYQHQFIELDPCLLLKLIKLTVISMVQENEGKSLSLHDMESIYSLSSAVNHYNAMGGTEVCHLLESIFFSMIDDELISLKINEAKKSIAVHQAYLFRDCYNPHDIQLLVLKEEDIPRNLGTSYAKLDKWLKQVKEASQTTY